MTQTIPAKTAPDHSILSPSSSERWHNCSGSVQLIAQCPEVEPSKYAEQGTAAHLVAARILRGENLVSGKVKTDYGSEFTIHETDDKDHTVCLDHIALYVNYVNGVIEQYKLQPNQIRIEHKLKLRGRDADGNERFGTADFMAFIPGVMLLVVDFKYGAGVGVDPAGNLQCLDYLVGAYDEFTPEQRAMLPLFKVVIVQPRGASPGIKEASFTAAALETHRDTIDAAIMRVFQKPTIVAGPWCKNTFCPAKAHCEVAQRYAEETTGMKYDMIVAPDQPIQLLSPREATVEQLAFICERESYVINWMNEMRKEAKRRHLAGELIPRHKIVEKDTHRKFRSIDEAETVFAPLVGDAMYTAPKLISPNQMETVYRAKNGGTVQEAKEFVNQFTYNPPGEDVLVHESAKGKAKRTNGEAYQEIIDTQEVS